MSDYPKAIVIEYDGGLFKGYLETSDHGGVGVNSLRLTRAEAVADALRLLAERFPYQAEKGREVIFPVSKG